MFIRRKCFSSTSFPSFRPSCFFVLCNYNKDWRLKFLNQPLPQSSPPSFAPPKLPHHETYPYRYISPIIIIILPSALHTLLPHPQRLRQSPRKTRLPHSTTPSHSIHITIRSPIPFPHLPRTHTHSAIPRCRRRRGGFPPSGTFGRGGGCGLCAGGGEGAVCCCC